MKKIFFLLALIFVFSSCQKCWQCTSEKKGQMDIEIEICEDDKAFDNTWQDWYGEFGITPDHLYEQVIVAGNMSPKEFVDMLDEQEDVRCHSTLW